MNKRPYTGPQLILRLGNLLKTDLTYVLRGGSWLTVGQGFSALLAFFLSVAFAHFVSKEIYGEYKFILSLATMIGVFTLSGATSAVTQATGAGFDGTILSIKAKLLRFNLVLFPIATILSLYYFTQGTHTVALSLLIVGVTSPLIATYSIYNGFLVGKKDFQKSMISSITITFLTTIGLITAMVYGKSSSLIFVAIYFVLTTVGTLFFYRLTIRQFQPDPGKVDDRATTYGAHLSIMNVFSIIASQIDKIVVYHFLGPVQLAIYSFAQAIPDQIRGVLKNMNTLMLPRFSSRRDEDLMRSLWRKMYIFGALIILGVLLYILAAPLIFDVLFPQYRESVIFSQVIALSLIAFTANVPATAVQSRMDKKILYIFNISLAVIQILLVSILVPIYGLWGAVASVVGARFYSFFFWLWITFSLSRKYHKISPS